MKSWDSVPFTKISHILILYCLVLVGTLVPNEAKCDHFARATINYACLGGNQFKITLNLLLDCSGTAPLPNTLNFSNACGVTFSLNNLPFASCVEESPLCPSQAGNSSCSGGTLPSYRWCKYETTLFLSPCALGPWTISWFICCRQPSINIANVPGTYVEAKLYHTAGSCDASPTFSDNGTVYVCTGQPISYNFGAVDPNGDSMVFSLITARFGAPAPTPVTYAPGYSGVNPIPGIVLQPSTGQLTFTPSLVGRYYVALLIQSYDSGGILKGETILDVTFVSYICDETPPTSSIISNVTPGIELGPNSIGVCQGQLFCFEMSFADVNPAASIQVSSNALTLLPGATFTVTGTNPAVARICWVGNAADLPVNVFIQGNDGACPIPNINSRSILVGDCLSPLPIQLIEFRGSSRPHDVLLEWVTASEMNNKEFLIERSADGRTFEAIGTVPGAGYSTTRLEYTWIDDEPLPSAAYYRLRQMDFDGSHTLSDVIVAGRTSGRPEPMVTKLTDGTWWLSMTKEGTAWRILDLSGRLLAESTIPSEGGLVIPDVTTGGMVMLTVLETDGTYTGSLLPGAAPPGTTITLRSSK